MTNDVRLDPNSGYRWLGRLGLALSLLVAGCASQNKEHRYTIKTLPPELRAEPWQAPCTADLSHGLARRQVAHIEAGDTVDVTLLGDANPARVTHLTAAVAPDGTVVLPTVGRIRLAGKPIESAGQSIVQARAVSGERVSPLVQVSVKEFRQNRVTVLGAVARPGIYALPRNNSDVVSALASAGGMTREAGKKIVVHSRPMENLRRTHAEIELAAMTEEDDSRAAGARANQNPMRREFPLGTFPSEPISAELTDGDVVVVELCDPPSILVTGTVGRPGRYDLPVGREYRVLDAIASAQGISNKVVDTVVVCRRLPGQEQASLIQVSVHDATRNVNEDLILVPGDIVSVEPTPKSLFKDGLKYIGTAAGGVGMAVMRR